MTISKASIGIPTIGIGALGKIGISESHDNIPSCDQLTFSDIGSTDVSLVINNNNVQSTNTTAAAGQTIVSATNVFRNVESDILVSEITINSQSSTGALAGLVFGEISGLFGGIVLLPGTGTAADGQFFDLNFVPIGGPVQITLPHTIQLILDGSTGQFSFNDGVNTGNCGLVPGISSTDSTFYGFAAPAAGIGEVVDFTANGGFTPLSVTPPASSKFWCELNDAGAPVSSTEMGAYNDPSVRSANLFASVAGAFNQLYERDLDARMKRTTPKSKKTKREHPKADNGQKTEDTANAKQYANNDAANTGLGDFFLQPCRHDVSSVSNNITG